MPMRGREREEKEHFSGAHEKELLACDPFDRGRILAKITHFVSEAGDIHPEAQDSIFGFAEFGAPSPHRERTVVSE